MFLDNMQEETKQEHLNFSIGSLFQEEKSFGDIVAADIAAVKAAQTDKGLTKTAKAAIAVGLAGVGIVIGYLVIKKLKK